MNKRIISISLLVCIVFYITSYCCIYTAFIMFEMLDPLEPEYRCKDMIGTKYMHAYVHVNGFDLFLNPLTDYSDDYRVYHTSDEFIMAAPNWGQLYIPIFDRFIHVT